MRLAKVSRLLLAGLLALCIVTVGLVLVHYNAQAKTNGGPGVTVTAATLGSPAITPHLNLQSADPMAATYTEADVRTYVLATGFAGNPVVAGHTLQIVSVTFETSAQASAGADLAGESTGLPDSALVCVVKVTGPFLLTQMHGPIVGPPSVAPAGVLVFSGKSGNLLLWGSRGS